MHRICSDEVERKSNMKVLKNGLIRTGYNAQLIDHQFRHATAKNHNDLLRRQTQDMTDKVPFVVQYFPGAEKLHHVLCSLQHIIDNNEYLTTIFSTPPLLASKQPPSLKQIIVLSNYPAFRTTSTTTAHNPAM
eukprot:g33298.t1